MNAGGVDEACKSNEFIFMADEVGTRGTYPRVRDNHRKAG